MSQKNSNRSTTGLVTKYIGTAYDTVKLVADNMASVIKVAGLDPNEFVILVQPMDANDNAIINLPVAIALTSPVRKQEFDAAIAAMVSADGSVTSHSDVTDVGSGAIITVAERALVASALQAETVTSIAKIGNTLRFIDENAAQTDIDLSIYLDDTNLAQLVSGTTDANGLATFVRDDASSFTVDFSGVFAGKEDALGNPANDGDILSSTTAGVRSWVRPEIHSDAIVWLKTAQDFPQTFQSDKVYWIDGIIDLTGTGIQIEVPAGGINFAGWSFDLSQIICSDGNYTMFTSPIGGSGNILGKDYALTTSGANSAVYDLISATGNEAFEFTRINYNGCTSLGFIAGYRQGLEIGTGRFGGTPSLTLIGPWAGGYFIDTSIVRGLDNAMTEPLFKAGAGFVMQSRFRSNMNVDLGTNAPLLDFSPANFPNANTLQLEGGLVTRNGTPNVTDSTITPNISNTDLASSWTGNIGLPNTFVGGALKVTTEATTTIAVAGIFADLAGTWTASDLQHFDASVNGQLKHLGDNPIEFKVIGDVLIDGTANDELVLRITKWDEALQQSIPIADQVRVVNNFQGGRDVAIFNFDKTTTLSMGDYIVMSIANIAATNNVTAELDSEFRVEAR